MSGCTRTHCFPIFPWLSLGKSCFESLLVLEPSSLDKCSYCLIKDASLYNRDHPRKTQLDTMQRSTGTSTSKLLHLWLRGHGGREAKKRLLRARIPEVSCEAVPPRNGCIHKTGTIGMLTFKGGKISQGTTPNQRTAGNY